MSERTMRGRVVRDLKSLNAIAVENPALPGTPDVNYVEGWIELKQLPEWPAREETTVNVSTFTPQQRVWHLRRRMAGGISWLLLQVGQEFLLIDGAQAALSLGHVTRRELVKLSSEYTARLKPGDLLRWISQKQSCFTLDETAMARLKLKQPGVTESPSADTLAGKKGP